MPIKKAAFKALRADKKRQARNLAVKVRLKNTDKRFVRTLRDNKKEEAEKIAKDYIKQLDKAVQNGVMKKNTASRTKSRLMKRLKRLLTEKK